jgi:hypothetical protein
VPLVAIHVKQQIPEIMVPVCPGSAGVIENTIDRIGRQIERQILQSDVTVQPPESPSSATVGN